MALYIAIFLSILLVIYALFRSLLMRAGLAVGLVVLLVLESIAPSQVEIGLRATGEITRSTLRNFAQLALQSTHGADPLIEKYIKCWEQEDTFIPSKYCKERLTKPQDANKNQTYIENEYSRRLSE